MTGPAVCLTNLTAAGKRRRLVIGAIALAATLVAHFAGRPAPGSWPAVLGVALLFYGWLCVMQAAAGT